jgi:hypothetical protein
MIRLNISAQNGDRVNSAEPTSWDNWPRVEHPIDFLVNLVLRLGP